MIFLQINRNTLWDEWSKTPLKHDYECKSYCLLLRKQLAIFGGSKCLPSILQLLMSSTFFEAHPSLSKPVAKRTKFESCRHLCHYCFATFVWFFVVFSRKKMHCFIFLIIDSNYHSSASLLKNFLSKRLGHHGEKSDY